jgi:hypothetical protein
VNDLDELFEDSERLKIRFIAAYEKLWKEGLITEAELVEITDAVDRIDELSDEEFERILGKFKGLPINQ